MLYILLAILIYAYIFSTGTLRHDKQFPYMKIKLEKKENYFVLFHSFGVLWNIALILSASDFIITGATCIWYYNNHEDGKNPVSRPIWWLLRYHLGTVSFGALLLAIIWVFRIIVEYIEVKK